MKKRRNERDGRKKKRKEKKKEGRRDTWSSIMRRCLLLLSSLNLHGSLKAERSPVSPSQPASSANFLHRLIRRIVSITFPNEENFPARDCVVIEWEKTGEIFDFYKDILKIFSKTNYRIFFFVCFVCLKFQARNNNNFNFLSVVDWSVGYPSKMCRKTIFIKTRLVAFFRNKNGKSDIFPLRANRRITLSFASSASLFLTISLKLYSSKLSRVLIQIFFIIYLLKKITRLLSFPSLHSNTQTLPCKYTRRKCEKKQFF